MPYCPCGTFIKDGGTLVCFQVDELYEAFCIQSRLRDGASRMKQAFSSSPSTKGTKESITEVNRRYKEYTEVPAQRMFFSVCGSKKLHILMRNFVTLIDLFIFPDKVAWSTYALFKNRSRKLLSQRH